MSNPTFPDPEVGIGGPDHPLLPPLKNHKNIGFLCCNTCPDCLKNHKAANQALNAGSSSSRQRNTI